MALGAVHFKHMAFHDFGLPDISGSETLYCLVWLLGPNAILALQLQPLLYVIMSALKLPDINLGKPKKELSNFHNGTLPGHLGPLQCCRDCLTNWRWAAKMGPRPSFLLSLEFEVIVLLFLCVTYIYIYSYICIHRLQLFDTYKQICINVCICVMSCCYGRLW